jgi:hypothetical protein
MELSDASEKIHSDTTGDRSGDLLTSSADCVAVIMVIIIIIIVIIFYVYDK